MKRFITLLLVSLSAILLIACSKQSNNSLDGEYYSQLKQEQDKRASKKYYNLVIPF